MANLEILAPENWPKMASAANDSTKALRKWVGEICGVIRLFSNRLEKAEKENVELKTEIEKLKQNKQQNKNAPSFSFAEILKEKPDETNEAQLVMLAQVNAEMSNKKRIETNIIISGIASATNPAESKTHDEDQVDLLLKAIEPNLSLGNTKRVIRLKKKNNRNEQPELLLVELDTVVNQKLVIQNTKKLKENQQLKSVYINNDKTDNERILESKLRVERNKRNAALPNVIDGTDGRLRYNVFNDKKYYWGIRSGELKWIQIHE